MKYIVLNWKGSTERYKTLAEAEEAAMKTATRTVPSHILEILEAEPLKTQVVL